MWDAFKDLIFQIIQFFYDFCGDWGPGDHHRHGHLPRAYLSAYAQADEVFFPDAEGSASDEGNPDEVRR